MKPLELSIMELSRQHQAPVNLDEQHRMLWMILNNMPALALELVVACIQLTQCPRRSNPWGCAYQDLLPIQPSPLLRCENVRRLLKQSRYAWRKISDREI